eukprot:768694-Hanusia_phi.AAC.9
MLEEQLEIAQEVHLQIHMFETEKNADAAVTGGEQLERTLSEQSGHSSSALWTLLRIEGYIASLASRIVQLDVPKMAMVLMQPGSARDLHEAALAIAALSWNSSGRQQLLDNSMIVPSLMSLLPDDGNHSTDQTADEKMICGRYASMAIANFCLEEKGEKTDVTVVGSGNSASLRHTQRKGSRLRHLRPAGNRKSVHGPGSQKAVLADQACTSTPVLQRDKHGRDSLQPIQEALGAEDPIIMRFAVGAVRNFATDEECREAIMKLPGLLEILQVSSLRCPALDLNLDTSLKNLAKSNQPRIREHAEAALSNLGVSGFLRTSRSSQDEFMCCHTRGEVMWR